MTLKLNSKRLLTALTLCAKAVNQNGVLATACYRFRKVSDMVEISTCNMEVSISTELDCDSKEMFDIMIIANKLKAYISSIPDQPITFTTKDEIITCKHSSGFFELPFEDGNDFPVIINTGEDEIKLQMTDLSDAITQTEYARMNDDTGNILNGLSFEPTENGLVIFCANGYKMSRRTISGVFEPCKLLLPKGIVHIISSLNLSGEVKITYSDKAITISNDDYEISSLLMAEKYVEWRNFIANHDASVLIDRNELLSAIKRALLMANFKTQLIRLQLNKDGLFIIGDDSTLSQAGQELVRCDYAGDAFNIATNGQYAVEALSHLNTESVYMFYKDKKTPLLFREFEDSKDFALIASLTS